MIYKTFDELITSCQSKQKKKTVAVVCANHAHTLEAVLMAWHREIARPILIGPREEILQELSRMDCNETLPIMDASSPEEAVLKAIDLVKNGMADAIFKGLLDTSVFMRAIVRKENGMVEEGHLMSHITMLEVPSYHKLVSITDGALLTYPTLEQKKLAIINAVNYLQACGFDEPYVSVLAAVEKLNPKMPETVDADALKQMNRSGEIPNCYVEGPISYDLAMKPGAAKEKKYDSPAAGNTDLLVVPNITAGNILLKSLTCSAGAKGSGLVLGAKVPVILTSRSTSTEGKFRSIVLASAM